jgi:hypothetical protein
LGQIAPIEPEQVEDDARQRYGRVAVQDTRPTNG